MKLLSQVAIMIFLLITVYHGYAAITSYPTEGDSVHYHIPIASFYLNGKIFHPPDKNAVTQWYPGTIEGILSLFLLLHIPLNLFNVLANVVLFFVLYAVGKQFRLDKNTSIIFAAAICTSNAVVRLLQAQKIDIWLTIFFLLTLLLLNSPKMTKRYFLALGITTGMIIGGKYTGPFFVLFLFSLYFSKIQKYLKFLNIIIFTIPVIAIGISWYIRNYLVIGDPMYPQWFLFFKGHPLWENGGGFLMYPVWKALVFNTSQTVNAYISEYMVWTIYLFFVPITLAVMLYKKKFSGNQELLRLLSLSMLCFIVYLFLPSDIYYGVMVFGIRYSYTAFVIGVLCIFLVAKKLHKELLLAKIAIANMIFMLPQMYHPKLLLVYLPFSLLLFIFFDSYAIYLEKSKKYLRKKMQVIFQIERK